MAASTVAAAVAALFDMATPEEARTLDGITHALARKRARPIRVVDTDDLPAGVCGRWARTPTEDVLELRAGLPTRNWTWAHELGHMALAHQGSPVTDVARGSVTKVNAALIEYMLNRGHGHGQTKDGQEDEAEAFAGLLMSRLRQTSRSSMPAVKTRLRDTLS